MGLGDVKGVVSTVFDSNARHVVVRDMHMGTHVAIKG
jgi:hypothetical protein